MYFDTSPCSVCGADVELRPAQVPDETGGPVGPSDGYVGAADSTIDERVCTNPECPTHGSATR